MYFKCFILNVFIFVFIVACGSSGSSNTESSDVANDIPPEIFLTKLNKIEIDENNIVTNTENNFTKFKSEEFTFTLSQDAKSFLLDIEVLTNVGDSSIGFASLIDPNGKEYILEANSAKFEYLNPNESVQLSLDNQTSLFLPFKSETEIVAGTWKFKVFAYSVNSNSIEIDAYLLERKHEISARPKIYIESFISSDNYSAANVKTSLDNVVKLFNKFNIDVEISEPIELVDSEKSLSFDQYINVINKDLILKGDISKISLFLVDSFLFPDSVVQPNADLLDILGLSGGIPGVHGRNSANSYIAINLSAFTVDSVLNDFSDVVSHEIGHYLGLRHTSESTGTIFDLLSDTDECPASADVNNDGIIDGLECPDHGGKNLMFWLKELPIEELSAEQFFIIQHSPLVR